MKNEINILLISGSVREDSYTRSLATYATAHLTKKGVNANHWNLRDKPLPIMDPDLRNDVDNHPDADVREFARLAKECDGYVWASPIYHNSYSGVLKNAVDHLRNPHFAYKPIGLIGHGGGGAKQAVDHLRIVTRAVNAIATPTIITTSEGDYEHMELSSEEIKKRFIRFTDELILFAETFRPLRAEHHAKDK